MTNTKSPIWRKLAATFDLNFGPDAELIEWLETRKVTNKDNFSDLMKDGLRALMARDDKDPDLL